MVDYLKQSNLQQSNFIGTAKIDGSNCSLVEKNKVRSYQSRNNIITIDNDHLKFAAFAESKIGAFDSLYDKIYSWYDYNQDYVYVIYGEYFGKNIQRDLAVSQVKRSFAIFDVIIFTSDNFIYLPPDKLELLNDHANRIYNVYEFGTFNLKINLDNLDEANAILETNTLQVGKQCPVGKYFGIEGRGEGVVYSCYDPLLKFKVKTDESSVVYRHEKNLAKVEETKNIQEFIDYSVTENRLNQGLTEIFNGKKIDESDVPDFIRWVVADVLREEDLTIQTNNLDLRRLKKAIGKKARDFIMNKI